MKKLVLALCALSLLGGAAPSFAATQCRNAKGHFIKCPAKPKVCLQNELIIGMRTMSRIPYSALP